MYNVCFEKVLGLFMFFKIIISIDNISGTLPVYMPNDKCYMIGTLLLKSINFHPSRDKELLLRL